MKKEKIKKEKKIKGNPFGIIFKQFYDFVNQKFSKTYQKINDTQCIFRIRDDINNPIKVIFYIDKTINVYSTHIRINNILIDIYLSNIGFTQKNYIYDNKNTIEQLISNCSFIKGQAKKELLNNAYDKLSINIEHIKDFLNTIK